MKRAEGKSLKQGVTTPRGFFAAGLHAGVKKKAKDCALLFTPSPAACAALFTDNRIQGESLLVTKKHLQASSYAQALLVISGVANCCVGTQGREDAEELASKTARALDISRTSCLIGTTGIIGVPLPKKVLLASLPKLVARLHRGGGGAFAESILTTDTRPKIAQTSLRLSGGSVRMGGCAKGAGMIAPHLATMFAFLTTDVKLTPQLLRQMLRRAAAESFQRITVDGDRSPADMVLAFANGAAQVELSGKREEELFQQALTEMCRDLALQIVRDGEGATKLVTITVSGARSQAAALQVARCIANSLLVKTALFGQDPNWGRVLTAAGSAGVAFSPQRTVLSINGRVFYERGEPAAVSAKRASKILKKDTVAIQLDLGRKNGGRATVYTCDLSYDYVRINAEYHT